MKKITIIGVIAAALVIALFSFLIKDRTAPELRVINEPIVAKGSKFMINDYFQAQDDRDGDITSSIICEGDVDSSKEGTCNVTLRVSDRAGNTSEKEISFRVISAQIPADQIKDLKGKYADRKSGCVLSLYDNYGKAMYSFQQVGGKTDVEGSVCSRKNKGKTTTLVLSIKDTKKADKKGSFRFVSLKAVRKGKYLTVKSFLGFSNLKLKYVGDDWESVDSYLR